ncbi:MAG: ATP-binding cassette domain-containing protein [Nitrospira sp.]|nr:ATP-binding cassette domain-containing protein [Nitrospira sp.]
MERHGMTSGASHGPDSPVVRVAGFRKRYKKHVAVDGIDLTVNKGEIYGLIGPDGAGKSSLMKAVAGVLTYDEGVVEVFGITVDSEQAAERIKSRIGFLPQGLGLNLYPELSVEENIDFFADLHAVPRDMLDRRKAGLLALTKLDRFRDRPMKHLSGGMKQKLGLICTLIHEPELAVLDEPTTGVDPVSRRDFWSILSELVQEKGMTALVSTAYMDEAERFHHLSFLSNGKVLASGAPAKVRAAVPGFVATFEVASQREAITRLKQSFRQVDSFGPSVRVFIDGDDQVEARRRVAAAVGDLACSVISVSEPELEDVFASLLLQRAGRREPPGPVQAGAAAYDCGEAAIEAEALTRDFGSFRAVDHVTFQVKQGEIFGLLGANGAGKTTVIKMLTGILPPTAGTGLVAGADMQTAARSIKERIGYMSQAFSLYLDLTVEENIRLFAGIYGLDRRATTERLRWIVAMAGLSGYESSVTGRLPMGVRQRLALGCALVHGPRVLFLDEPTAGVDPLGRRRFWDLLAMLAREQGVAILITTHYMSEAEHCDRLALMHAGRIVAEGSPADLQRQVRREAGSLFEVVVDQPGRALTRLQGAGFLVTALYGTKLHFFCRDRDQDKACARRVLEESGVNVLSVNERPLSLEDVFVYRIMELERVERPFGQTVGA